MYKSNLLNLQSICSVCQSKHELPIIIIIICKISLFKLWYFQLLAFFVIKMAWTVYRNKLLFMYCLRTKSFQTCIQNLATVIVAVLNRQLPRGLAFILSNNGRTPNFYLDLSQHTIYYIDIFNSFFFYHPHIFNGRSLYAPALTTEP